MFPGFFAFQIVPFYTGAHTFGQSVVTANLETFEGGNVRLADGTAPNSAITEFWESFEDELFRLGIPRGEIVELRNQFRRNPGDFMKRLSETKDIMSMIGKGVVETSKPDDGGKK